MEVGVSHKSIQPPRVPRRRKGGYRTIPGGVTTSQGGCGESLVLRLFAVLSEKKGETYESASTQIRVPSFVHTIMDQLHHMISADDLGPTGIEDEPHATLIYGFSDEDFPKVKDVLEGQGPVRAQFWKLGVFPSKKEEQEALIIHLESEDLRNLHDTLKAKTGVKETFPEYKPHITIAYVKPGRGKVYVESLRVPQVVFEADTVEFSASTGAIKPILLSA